MAVDYLHDQGLFHRDIKAENIAIDGQGYLKLIDFGLATLSCQRRETFCGTPEYMAPEIVADQAYDAKVDNWAIGILIYEMIKGTTPFLAMTNEDIYDTILRGEVEWAGLGPAEHLVRGLL